MDFFNSAIDVLQTLVIALGGGLCVWGGINLLEGQRRLPFHGGSCLQGGDLP